MITFDADNHLYVVGYSNNRVQIFGSYLLQFGHRGSGNGQLNGPVDIVVYNDKVMLTIVVWPVHHIMGSAQLSNPWDEAATSNDSCC